MMTEYGIEPTYSGAESNNEIRNELDEIVKNTGMFALTEEDVKIQYRSKLGGGTFCDVYPVHIRNRKNKRFDEELPPFALKQLNFDILSHPNPNVTKAAYDDLAREARIMKELQHDHILSILGMSQQQQEGDNIATESLFIILEKLESTLDSKLDEWAKTLGFFRKITPKETVAIRINEVALAIGQALQYIHSQHYVFRDLKPSNIGFDQSGSVKIFDFGLTVRIPTSSGESTVIGKIGTLRYMAPETRRGERYSYPIDVYAYAILLWQMITARVPFEEDIPVSFIAPTQGLSYDKRPDLKYVESETLRKLLKSSWKTSPEERLTLDELIPELQRIGRQMQFSCRDCKKKKGSFRSKILILDDLTPEKKKKVPSIGSKILALDELIPELELTVSKDENTNKKQKASFGSKILIRDDLIPEKKNMISVGSQILALDELIPELQRTVSKDEYTYLSPSNTFFNSSSVSTTVSKITNFFEKNCSTSINKDNFTST